VYVSSWEEEWWIVTTRNAAARIDEDEEPNMNGAPKRLQGRVAIITGAGSGIGKAIAQRLASEGATVVVADIRGGEPAASGLRAAGACARAIDTDVSREDSVHALVAETVREFGRIDILVNNAALASTLPMRPFESISLKEWERVYAVNVVGSFLCARAAAPHLRASGAGRVINMASGTAFKGAPFMLDYVSSKGAVMAMTRALARELGRDAVTVNAVSPGFTLSEGVVSNEEVAAANRDAAIASRAMPRDAWPEDIVGAVAFLASDDAAFITGQILAVDGGSVYH